VAGGSLWVPCGTEKTPDRPAIELQRMLSKRAAAVLFGINELGRTGRCYLWTFTFKRVLADFNAAALVRHLLRRIKERLGRFGFVRVFELHPGGHGLHCHMVCNRRLAASVVWELAEKTGLGIVDVRRIRKGEETETALYMSKYFSKGRGQLSDGIRAIGFGGMSQTIRTVEVDSKASRSSKYLWRVCKGRGVKPTLRDLTYCKLTGQPPIWTL